MATFCSKCGAQETGNERFCPKCGNDLAAGAAAPAVAVAPAPVAQPVAPPPPAYSAPPPPPPQYVAPPPQQGYPAPGPVPVMMPGAEPAKKNNTMWLVIAVAAAAAGWYYYHTHPPNQATTNPPAQTQPAPQQPGANPGGAPPPAAPAQPGGPGPGGANAALVQAQQWSSQEEPANGYVQVQNGKWTNNSTTSVVSSTLECDQYDTNQAVLAQNQTKLTVPNPPLAPGSYATFNNFNMGQIVQGVNSVNCGIVDVSTQ